jgi:hypothetical protein
MTLEELMSAPANEDIFEHYLERAFILRAEAHDLYESGRGQAAATKARSAVMFEGAARAEYINTEPEWWNEGDKQ